jgi:hypothetical protein
MYHKESVPSSDDQASIAHARKRVATREVSFSLICVFFGLFFYSLMYEAAHVPENFLLISLTLFSGALGTFGFVRAWNTGLL